MRFPKSSAAAPQPSAISLALIGCQGPDASADAPPVAPELPSSSAGRDGLEQ